MELTPIKRTDLDLPEIIDFFQSRINKNLTPAQIEIIVNTINPNPIYGKIIDLLYIDSDENLMGITVENSIGIVFFLVAQDGISESQNTIILNNLNAFTNRLQEAFNYNSTVIIKYDSNQILSVVITKITQQFDIVLSGNPGKQSKIKCLHPRFC